MKSLLATLNSTTLANLITDARRRICYIAPGIQQAVAEAIVAATSRLGREYAYVALDFSERVFRMGYGDIEAVRLLREADIEVHSSLGLRTALVITDDIGFAFTPTALLLEDEPKPGVRSDNWSWARTTTRSVHVTVG